MVANAPIGFLFTALSVFSWVCWIAPSEYCAGADGRWLNEACVYRKYSCEPAIRCLFWPGYGYPDVRLGMSQLRKFDLNLIMSADSNRVGRQSAHDALVGGSARLHRCVMSSSMIHAAADYRFSGFVVFFWVRLRVNYTPFIPADIFSPSSRMQIITPILYYTNVWNLSYFPMAESLPYDRFGNVYNVTRVLTADNRFNITAYEEYSPLYLPATYAVTYVLALALFTCVIVHTLLYHGRSLWNGFKRVKVEPDDIHAKLMSHYPEVPDW